MAVITKTEAKAFLGITDTSKDSIINILIPEIQGQIEEYCNTDFLDDNGVEVWPAGIKLTASKMIGFNITELSGAAGSIGMQSESQGGYSYTKAATGNQDYPLSILSSLDKWRVARVHFGSLQTQSRDRRGESIESLAKDKYLDGIDGVPYAD